MDNKGLPENFTEMKTPDVISTSEKPLISDAPKKTRPNRVDINVLKSKLQENESKEFKKNMIIFLSFLLGLGSLGIYLSI